MRRDARDHGLCRAPMGIATPMGGARVLDADDHVCALYAGPGHRDGSLVPLLAEALHIRGRRGYLVEVIDLDPDSSARPSVCYSERYALLKGLNGPLGGALPPVHAPAEMTCLLHAGCDLVEPRRRPGAVRSGTSSRGGHVLLCLYDVQRLPGRLIVDVLRTHPRVVTGRQLLDNPYFAAPAVIPELTA